MIMHDDDDATEISTVDISTPEAIADREAATKIMEMAAEQMAEELRRIAVCWRKHTP